MTTLYIVRHGHIERRGRFIARTDVPLSGLGHEQAVALGRLLSSVPFTACLSSPLARALATARHILAENNHTAHINAEAFICALGETPLKNMSVEEVSQAKINIIPELQEISLGLWEGKSKTEVVAEHPEIWEQRGNDPAGIAPPQGENYRMLHKRLVPVFQALASYGTTGQAGNNVLVVAHRSVAQVLMGHYSRFPFETWPNLALPYGSVSLCSL